MDQEQAIVIRAYFIRSGIVMDTVNVIAPGRVIIVLSTMDCVIRSVTQLVDARVLLPQTVTSVEKI